MSLKNGEKIGQSPGDDPIPKGGQRQRGSGLFSILKWFRPSSSRESVTQELSASSTSSLDSAADSISSSGTIASFSFVPAGEYHSIQKEKSIAEGPETDTYRARLKQRDHRRESDRNLTLRKKYNLFFHREGAPEVAEKKNKNSNKNILEEDNSKSLPLMTKKTMETEDEKSHRRTNSESSKVKRAGAYCHVKGKRKAPQPPINRQNSSQEDSSGSTLSLRRRKRLAPHPPLTPNSVKSSLDKYDNIEYADADVLFNDFLKLDHGILKPAKEPDNSPESSGTSNASSVRNSVADAPVSPRPWYKRNLSRESKKEPARFEYLQKTADVQFVKAPEEPKQQRKDDKRKSALSFLTNISELDREASEIVKKGQQEADSAAPAFMRPKQEEKMNGADSLVSPKRKSARDLIAKFNAITNVTKVTVNSAFFGAKEPTDSRRDYFGKSDFFKGKHLPKQTKSMEEPVEKSLDHNRNKMPALMKSESAAIIPFPTKSECKKSTPKFERKSWLCPKCSHNNEYWRIICCLCSTIKPYFDDLGPQPSKNSALEKNKTENSEIKRFPPSATPDAKNTSSTTTGESNLQLERSKTQIGFSALAKYNNRNSQSPTPGCSSQVDYESKEQERERLKKMLIEMKNSLPKRRLDVLEKQKTRTKVIQERESEYQEIENPPEKKEAQVVLVTAETVYENIKMKKTDNPKPLKISSAAQTSGVLRSPIFIPGVLGNKGNKSNFELMRPKDFDHIYSVKAEKSEDHLYANLLDKKDLFLNMPIEFNEMKNNTNNADTLEINRLLKRLETSIARGDLSEAGNLARDLAQMRVNCSVIRQKSAVISAENSKRKTGFMIDMFVEDKVSHRGPFPILVTAKQTVAELKKQIEEEYQIPMNVQRWILGKELASDDKSTMASLNVAPGDPVFLYLVAPSHGDLQVVAKNEEIKIVKDPTKEPIPSCSKTSVDIIPVTEQKINITPEINDNNIISSAKNQNNPKSDLIKTFVEEKHIQKVELNIKSEKRDKQEMNSEITEAEISLAQPSTTSEENAITPEKINLITKVKIAPLEDLKAEEVDTKTLKPETPKNWECHMCTLINPINMNFCSVCATKRSSHALTVIVHAQEGKNTTRKAKGKAPSAPKDQHYLQLLNLDNSDVVENREPFECLVCFSQISSGKGVTLRECLHQFCRPCLTFTIEFSDDAQVKCPYRDDQYSCDIALQDREIKALVTPELYDQYLARSVAQAENKMDKTFHCKTPDCKGWCIFEDNVNEFRCPVCRKVNCLTCQVIHMGVNCKEYQERMREESSTDENAKRTQDMLEEMVQRGEAIKCPTCQVVLMKKWGCDWLRCSMCKTEICWVTRGPRWGPAGKGDTSAGCKCGVNGVKCHPQCNYCH